MLYMPPYKSKRKSKAVKKRTSFKKRSSNKAVTKNEVLKMIEKRAETKQAFTSSNATFFNSGVSGDGDMIQILPNIAKGTSDNQRIGDQITAQSMTIKGFVRFLPQPTTTVNTAHYGHVAIRLMVLSLKTGPNYNAALIQAASLGSLLKKGGTTVGFTGAISDVYAPINTDLFTKHYNKVFYVTQSYVITGDGTTNPKVAIDVSKLVKFFNIKVPCKKKVLKYDSSLSSDLLPSNFAPFLCAGYCYMNGDAPDYTTTNLQVSYDVELNYEDS